ncbi:hypothetical protein SUGI_0714810 [Cryptomeria japonica]|nr:hypothetical protein SUGI_0714810 [Cryptomeria japonica]
MNMWEATHRSGHNMDSIVEFDSSKIGVKGLSDLGIQQVPHFFIQPPHTRPFQLPTHPQIPLVSFHDIQGSRRPQIIQQILQACQTWGFFQVVDHTVPVSVMKSILEAAGRFNREPIEDKMKYYSHDYNNAVKFAPSFNLHKQTAVDWKDALRLTYAPGFPQCHEWPATLREESIDFCKHMRDFGALVLTLLSEALNLAPDYLTETINCMDRQIMMMNFYPPCPQPDLTLGTSIHSDMGSITVLLLDEVGGLQVKHNGDWVGVDPIHGAFVINIGDQLEILSNGRFKSVEHRAVTNDVAERVSIPTFFSLLMEYHVKIGPIPHLLNSEKPPHYKEIGVYEYAKYYMNNSDHSKSCLEIVRLKDRPL